MQDFTRRSLLQGGTALAAAGALTGPALLDFAKAWAQASPWKAEKGAKLTVMRWKRFVPAEDDAFNAMVAAFKTATGTEMNVFSESFEDVQPKASVAANTGSGFSTIPGPPPYDSSSTWRCLSDVLSRRSCTRTSTRAASIARPSRLSRSGLSKKPGKIVTTSIRTTAG